VRKRGSASGQQQLVMKLVVGDAAGPVTKLLELNQAALGLPQIPNPSHRICTTCSHCVKFVGIKVHLQAQILMSKNL